MTSWFTSTAPSESQTETLPALDIECDIWIQAARPDVVREENVHRLKTRLVLQAANIPFTAGAETALHDRGCW